jgi:hypothetical protein
MRQQAFSIFHFNYTSLLALLILLPFVFGCSFLGVGAKKDEKGSRDKGESKPKEEEKGLVGTWKNERATLRISADGMMTFNGVKYKYKANDEVITITGNDGSVEIPYSLDGDTLTLSAQGQEAVYRRVKQSSDDSSGKRGGNDGGVKQELVGKWCYMSNVNTNDGGRMSNRCITLNENGTYEYYAETTSSGDYGGTASQESDSGTWTATEDSITANSQSQGTRTYSLEKRNHPKTGDPMIVIDGDAYVTYGQRAPW